MDYEEDVAIDESALDVEWLRQPQLTVKYCRLATKTKEVVDQTKEQLDVTRAMLDRDIRSDPVKYNVVKITEGVVTNTILLQDEHQRASENYLQARYEYEMARVAVAAIQTKKDALENLVKLHGMQYFAGPSAPRDLSKERQRQSNAHVIMKGRTQRKRG